MSLALLCAFVSAAGVVYGRPRPAPRVVELTITAAPAKLPLVPGGTTEVLAYNGQVPGPTLEFREGDHVVIHFRNRLAEATSIHWHGLHIPAAADGSPLNPVRPGGSYDYVFDILPGAAGTYWYHPHPDSRTGYQVAKGLYGALIIRAADDPLAAVPEKLIVLSDNRLTTTGEVDLPHEGSPQ
jgi:bilirubin oxidase